MSGHNFEVALDWLVWLGAPWVLVAINQDQDGISAETFDVGQEVVLERWLVDNRHRNIYYHVNECLRPMRKKADREDISRVRYLHVDVDPRAGENFQEERTRIHTLFHTRWPSDIPKPSAVVDSGGGYNALWRLDQPIEVDGDLAKAEEAKRWNLQLEIRLGGDNCHNVDRILRLPGSINYPNEKKRRKGRIPSNSDVVWKNDTRHPLTSFTAAPLVQTKVDGGLALGGGIRVNIGGNVRRLASVQELPERVSARTRMLIVQGHDPDDPHKWSSRSELLFYVCCELVRAECTDEVIYSVVTDPDFLISASVLDKGSSAQRYAERQIQRAREDVVNPMLRTLNEKHAVIGNIGGRCRVVEEVIDTALDRPILTTQSFDDFRGRYMNQRVEAGHTKEGEVRWAPLGKWWLENANRRQYERIVFAPGKETPDSYNLWRGFACEAKPGDQHQIYLDHIRQVVCSGVEAYYDYLVKWMARAVQHPDSPGEVAVVMRGEKGTGKSTVPREFGKLWGRHYLQVSDPKHLVGSFNAHLRDAVVVFADEAFYAGDKKHESVLKTLITEELLVIESKGRDAETGRNFVHLMMASDGNWVVPAGLNERRYFVLDVGRQRMRDLDYFGRLRHAMDNGGRENLLHHLLNIDLSGWEVRTVPNTQALTDQKLLSLSTEQEWWYAKLMDGQLLRQHAGWTAPVFTDALLDDYLTYAQRLGTARRSSGTALGRFLHGVLPDGWPRRRQLQRSYIDETTGGRMTDRSYAWLMPPLDEARAYWDKHHGGPYPWPQDEAAGTQQTEQVF